MAETGVCLQDIYKARRTIAGQVRHTPLVSSPALSKIAGTNVRLKLETMQETGSFKLRGATNALAGLSPEERAQGVVGVSTGNHGRGVAHAAKALGVKAILCMSELVPQVKVDGIRALGAEARIIGRSQDEAQVEADRLVAEEGMVFVSPFDDPRVIAGQGTIGLELLEDLPDIDTVLVPLSGGGLISGIALALKTASPGIRVIGICMDRGAAMVESLAAGKPVEVEELPTLADSLGGGIGMDNRYTLEMVGRLVDDTVLLSEEQIAAGMAHAFHQERLVVEGGGSVGIGALIAGLAPNLGDKVAVVVSGRNVDTKRLAEIVGAG
ncbi:MAG: hydroxyectoine utilization dehydratase EutB [Pseudomonadota bacterium]